MLKAYFISGIVIGPLAVLVFIAKTLIETLLLKYRRSLYTNLFLILTGTIVTILAYIMTGKIHHDSGLFSVVLALFALFNGFLAASIILAIKDIIKDITDHNNNKKK